jgi:D-lactate dehydrogenase (cytochrome)
VADLLKRRGRPKFGTDFAVPLPAFRDLFAFYEEKALEFAAGRPGVHSALWGHVGDCHLHLNLLCETDDDPARAAAIYLELARKALSLGGALSAEHGVGKKMLADEAGTARPYLWYQYGDAYQEIAETKRVFDPQGILNAGNMGT